MCQYTKIVIFYKSTHELDLFWFLMASDVCFLALGSSFFSFFSFFCGGFNLASPSDLADLLDLADDVLSLLSLSADVAFLLCNFLPVPFPDFSSSEEDEEEEEDLEDSEEVSSVVRKK